MARKPRIKRECRACGESENLRYRYARTPDVNYQEGLGLSKWEGLLLCRDCNELALDGEWEELRERMAERE